jgi:hypothetical protein
LAILLVVVLVRPAAARPTAMELFPKETLAFARVAHARELFEKLKDSSMGRMLQDPNLKPLIDSLYASAEEAYAQDAEEEVGLSLAELQRIPQGEIAIGLIARDKASPTFALLVDMGEDPDAGRKLVERVQKAMIDNGAEESTRTVGDTELTTLASNADERVVLFERENTLVACGDEVLAESMLAFWNGQSPQPRVVESEDGDASSASDFWMTPLSENEQFINVMRTCRNPGDPPPQILWFVDPIEMFRQLNRDNFGAQVALGALPSLGLNRFQGVGGSFTFATDRYDDITHVHVLLDNPREGVLTLINLQSGDTTPERFVPNEWIDTYITVHWNVSQTFDRLGQLVDKMRNRQGGFEADVQENVNEEVGIDLRRDVIEQADGRVSAVFGFHQPVSLNRRSSLVAAHVKDLEAAQATFHKVLDRASQAGEQAEEASYGGVDYWVFVPSPFKAMEVEERPFEACFAFLEGCLVFANDRQILERAVAARDGTTERLADSLDFKLVHSRVGRLSEEPGLVLFNRPETGLRYMYELVNSDQARDFLAEQRENNRFFSAVDDALASHPLPAFEVIAKYFAPSGGILQDTSTGLHYYQFSLRRE